MGPKKEIYRQDTTRNIFSINDPINTDSWKCVVVMAVERTSLDSFVLKNFMEEAASGRRAEIKEINFHDFVLNILKDFTMGELPFKYAFLLNFSSIFKDAAEYFNNKLDIPLQLLVKVVKALLFYLREENLQRTERKVSGPLDPIKAMSERPTSVGNFDPSKTKNNLGKKKELTEAKSKQTSLSPNIEGELKIRPPSAGKLNTKLLKRGETSKQDQWIDDAPSNSFFNLYVLLTGFYNPTFPLELIKAKIPLHSILCIDSSSLIMKSDVSSIRHSFRKQSTGERSSKIQQFWNEFLNILWNPCFSTYFKEIIFQVFEPQAVFCNKKNLRDFIYKEISFLMYDLSDYKRQHLNYLSRLKLWNVKDESNGQVMKKYTFKLENFSGDSLTVPVILNLIIDIVEDAEKMGFRFYDDYSYDSIDLTSPKSNFFDFDDFSQSILPKIGPLNLPPEVSAIVRDKENINFVKVYLKVKTLDQKYNLEVKNYNELSSKQSPGKSGSDTPFCITKDQIISENYQHGLFYSFWKKLKGDVENKSFSVTVDLCLYPYLMTKIVCPYYSQYPRSPSCFISNLLSNKISNFKLIENIEEQMHKPHFTVTQGTRSVLKCFRHNLKENTKDFFCPTEYKIVTPEAIRVSSAPEFHLPPLSLYNISCLSDLIIPDKLIEEIDWDAFQNLEKFLGSSIFLSVDGFNYVEELSKQKLLIRDLQILDEYNCIDHMHSMLTDSVLIALHNRKNDNDIYYETFSNALKTRIGLRDFFEYILEEEIDSFKTETKLQDEATLNEGNSLNGNKNSSTCKDSYFWSENSIKYGELVRSKTSLKKDLNVGISREFKKKKSPETMYHEKFAGNTKRIADSVVQEDKTDFFQVEGYDIEDTAIRFSGLKTIYYAQDCTLFLELIEKLYGNQTLGVHIRQGGHTLHLFSYVCPTPHLPQPYSCHFMCNNGIILAFGKRFAENFEHTDVYSTLQESEITSNRLKNSLSYFPAGEEKNERSFVSALENEVAMFDLKLSTPNGLIVETIRKIEKPFYIKQHHLFKTYSKSINKEICRLFLPNKNLIKIMKNGTVEILKTDTSLVFASLDDLHTPSPTNVFGKKESEEYNEEANSLIFTKYDFVDSSGQIFTIDNGRITTSGKYQTFQSTNLQSQQIFFRRKDNTNYVINGNGTLCVQFEDGTKMCSSPFTEENDQLKKTSQGSENNDKKNEADFFTSNFVVIHEEVTFEHPSYATVIYNTQTKKWKILLPSDLSITIEKEGDYCTQIDKQTSLIIKKKFIEMKRLSPSEEWLCTAAVDLSVFEKRSEKKIYCTVEDSTGKTFVVESNSNSYVLACEKSLKEENEKERSPLLFEKTSKGSQDSIKCNTFQHQGTFTRGTKLSRDCKYFVLRNDMTGLEVIHKEDFTKILTELNDEDVIFTQDMSCKENLRCFILIRPECETKGNRVKWKVDSILPDPTYSPLGNDRTFSSTYGDPPSWMHPFPKKKVKFKIPENFTCRVFVETKKTDFFPRMASQKLQFCELDDRFEIEKDKIQLEMDNMQDYLKKISAGNQDLLRKMYVSVVLKLQETKKKFVPKMSEKLKHYLALNEYYLDMQEYHKQCLKNHLIPLYFHHPVGMSWLILYDLITNLKVSKLGVQQRISSKLVFSSAFSKSFCSNEEVEYNLSWCSEKSFSDLSYKSNLSVCSAPLLLRKINICTGEISSLRKTVSAPIIKLNEKISSQENIQVTPERLCEFKESEVDFLMQANITLPDEKHSMILGDIFHLGLI